MECFVCLLPPRPEPLKRGSLSNSFGQPRFRGRGRGITLPPPLNHSSLKHLGYRFEILSTAQISPLTLVALQEYKL